MSRFRGSANPNASIPAQAGTHLAAPQAIEAWVPACAGIDEYLEHNGGLRRYNLCETLAVNPLQDQQTASGRNNPRLLGGRRRRRGGGRISLRRSPGGPKLPSDTAQIQAMPGGRQRWRRAARATTPTS